MLEIAKEKVSIECPEYKRKAKVTIDQIVKSAMITCRCGQKIQLHDEGGTFKKSMRKINDSLRGGRKTKNANGYCFQHLPQSKT